MSTYVWFFLATPKVVNINIVGFFLWILHSEGALIRGSSVFVERCQAMIVRLQEVCPQLDTDGLNNIWIIKPGAKSRGRGQAFRKVAC